MAARDFKYEPQQFVSIKAYGLNYSGRILECIWDGKNNLYRTEFASDGKIDCRSFLEDEIE